MGNQLHQLAILAVSDPLPTYRKLVFEMRLTKVLSTSRNIRVAQEFAGHSQITTTEIYTHVLHEEMDKAVKNAFS